ncbi:Hypothetical predicted protein [Mytilus galloprovincialis]|uniref:Uncharacterized protein n=1 Tax=Mytilus galloprovincialis TaxID=29158 RepID=A0A8B6HJF9_MYTGA|nr:Hypothetical predicted protein [Mytilus galloprovincialis]
MRSVKSTGGLTRGRGMGEVQRTLWLLSIPTLAEYNHAMQQLTGRGYKTSNQHIENSKTRMERDNKDSNLLTDFLTERNPFKNDKTLRNIETGMVADSDANADEAKTVANGLPKQAAKATLADAIWNMGDCQAQELPETNIVRVIDGGSLLYRIPWIKGQTFSQICMKYIDHIRKRFSNPAVVMDGYNCSSTKDITHLRRSKGIQSNTITSQETCQRKTVSLNGHTNG